MKVLAVYLSMLILFVVKVELFEISKIHDNKMHLIKLNTKKHSSLIAKYKANTLVKTLEDSSFNIKFNTLNRIKNSTELKHQGVLLEDLVEKGEKKTTIQGNIIGKVPQLFNSIRFKENNFSELTKDFRDNDKVVKMKLKGFEDQETLAKDDDNPEEFSKRVRIFPYNIVINKKDLTLNKAQENIFVDNRILKKFLVNNSQRKSVKSHMIPMEDCNKGWDYSLHGEDWNCMCEYGKNQSPININSDKIIKDKIKDKSFIKSSNNNIYFDFKDNEPVCSSFDNTNCSKKPLIKNTGTSIEIEDDCGILVLLSDNNGYRCYKIEFKTPAEHQINSKKFELEMQIHYKLKDRNTNDETTRNNIIVAILFKAIDEDIMYQITHGIIIKHPFLQMLELDKLPKQKGHEMFLSKFLNYHLLFDDNYQQYKNISYQQSLKPKRGKFETENEIRFLEISNKITNKVLIADDVPYKKNYPLNEFYTYNGSFTNPPCEENVKYIVIPTPLYAPMKQILKISKVIIGSGNELGNNRELQKSEGREIFYFKTMGKSENFVLDSKKKKIVQMEEDDEISDDIDEDNNVNQDDILDI